ncbi:hypothetical protein HNV12_00230 [Methanococcoides sp. SA1]|nr:hypothetical protein [Methanococcoides sp. SA1]
MIDIPEKKNKIINFLIQNGPSLPVQVAKAIQMDPVFASAILSELLSSKQIITSHLKIGASPLYLLPTQTQKLEEKTEHLKTIEKQAQEKLREKNVIFDEEEEPAIRIALRNIKDFAKPFKFKEKITWKYAFTSQEKIDEILFPKETPKPETPKHRNTETPTSKSESIPKAWEVKKEEIKIIKKESEKKVENIFEEKPEIKEKPKPKETFLEKIENFLEKQDTKIKAIEEVDKTKVIATIEHNSKTTILFAFNRKRITEAELLKCYKHAKKKNLGYRIITKDTPTKKMQETIDAYKSLTKIQKLD